MLMTDLKDRFKKCIEIMRQDVAEFEAKYQGRFAEQPHVGLGNRKTRCVNEATLPIITCHPSCLEKCAGTCYVLAICTKPRPNCRKCEARNTVLRRIDPNAYYEHFYREAERLHLPIRLSDGGDFENEAQVAACIAAARRHPTVHAILYTKRIELLPALVDRPNTLHVRYSSWKDDDEGDADALLNEHFARIRFHGAGDDAEKRRLARTVAANDARVLAAFDVKRDVVEQRIAAKAD